MLPLALALVDGRLLIVGRLLTVGRLLVDGLLTLPLVLGRTDAPLLTVGRPEAFPLFTLALGALVPLDMLPLAV